MLPGFQLGVSLAGLAAQPDAPWAGGPRAAVEWAAREGFRAVQLDAAAAGARPRELDRSGRRDLAGLMRRLNLTPSGLDLWIPPEHLKDPARAERALEAIAQALELAADLSRLAGAPAAARVSVVLPADLPSEARGFIASQAELRGTRIADHRIGAIEGAPAGGPIGIGLDPAALLLAGLDPAAQAAKAGAGIVSARLSDASHIGRVAPGLGRLDDLGYTASLAVSGYAGPLILDLRGLPDQAAAAKRVLADRS